MRERCENILKRYRHRVDYLEIRLEETSRLALVVNQDGVSTINRGVDAGAAVRACHKGGWGFATLNDTSELEGFVGAAAEQARALGGDRTVLAEVEPVVAEVPLRCREDPRGVGLEEKLAILEEYNEIMLAHSDAIFATHNYYGERISRVSLATSEGTRLTRESLDMVLQSRPYARRNGVVQQIQVSRGSSDDFGVVRGLQEAVIEACRRSIEQAEAPPVKAGTYPVVLDRVLGGVFVHEAFGHRSEADGYQHNPKMREILTLGRRFGRDILTIYDTGEDRGSRGFLPYDDEGVPGGRVDLLREGILVGRLHSRESAGRFGEAPTGNARALSYRYPPICRMRNTAVAPGQARFEDLLEGIELGVYALGSCGGAGGEMFSFNADRGIMIRRGRLAEPVRDVTVSGNLFTTLERIDRIADDFRIRSDGGGCGKGPQVPLPIAMSSPSFRIIEANVGGAA